MGKRVSVSTTVPYALLTPLKCRKNAKTLGVNPGKVILLGGSGGGNIVS